ncbi:alpha/beta fold hydrolase [uncultured Jatrophihabitans sp.]|uniref:alpha/beta fold hydrolase n=1 Tax=uncultured Jatrophihabitans sp. TaxID=1610747 RepID=UPI0035CC8F00
MTDTATFVDSDGVEIFYRHWAPDGPPRASVVVAHGASEHSGRYSRFAGALTAAGFAVFAPDHRGHGRTSESTGVGLAGAHGFDGIVADVRQLVDVAAETATPVLLFGHSMGSIIALRYAEQHPQTIAALALSGSLGVMAGAEQMRADLQQAVDAGMADQPMDALGPFNEPFEPARTPFDWLSRDDAEVDKYLTDPYCGTNHLLTYGYMAQMVQCLLDGIADLDALPSTLPVLLASGGRDPVSNGATAVRELADRLRAAGIEDFSEAYYAHARHEILNETNREEVTADLVAWLERAAPR